MFYFSGALRATRIWDPEMRILGTSSFVCKGQQLPCTCISTQPSADELEMPSGDGYFVLVAN